MNKIKSLLLTISTSHAINLILIILNVLILTNVISITNITILQILLLIDCIRCLFISINYHYQKDLKQLYLNGYTNALTELNEIKRNKK